MTVNFVIGNDVGALTYFRNVPGSARDRRRRRARLGRRDNFRTDRDHLSQAPFGAVDEDGGVDAGDRVEAGNICLCQAIFVLLRHLAVLRANRYRRSRRRLALSINANTGQQDSQIGLFTMPRSADRASVSHILAYSLTA